MYLIESILKRDSNGLRISITRFIDLSLEMLQAYELLKIKYNGTRNIPKYIAWSRRSDGFASDRGLIRLIKMMVLQINDVKRQAEGFSTKETRQHWNEDSN